MILDDIVSRKRDELLEKKENVPLEKILKKLNKVPLRNFKTSLLGGSISIIGEIKKASPSKGVIVPNFNPECIARVYEKLDIDAVSVLTEKNFFKGREEYLKLVKSIVSKPILRKDFIVDEYQIYESRALGADAILLIVKILGNNLKKFYDKARSLGLQCIVEVHNRQELYNALNVNCEIIGINNRNLEDFTVNLKNTESLIKYIPESVVTISESGVKTYKDFKYMKSLGVNAVLIGETFMRKYDQEEDLNKFILQAKS